MARVGRLRMMNTSEPDICGMFEAERFADASLLNLVLAVCLVPTALSRYRRLSRAPTWSNQIRPRFQDLKVSGWLLTYFKICRR